MFIAFEGLDGSGSSTQALLLADRLRAEGHAARVTKEPTSTNPIGRMIRDVLQHKWESSPEALQLLFSADRAEHLRLEINPALENGEVVITDRYLFSTIAFGSLSVHDVNWLKQLNRLYPLPDLTFVFKLKPEECIRRIEKRQLAFGGKTELFEEQEKLSKIWKTYEIIIKDYPSMHLIDASKSVEEIAGEIWKIVEKNLKTSG